MSISQPALGAQEFDHLNGHWVLATINGKAVPTPSSIHFIIDGRRFNGNDGCNAFGGRLDIPDMLRIGQRACASGTSLMPLDLKNPLPQLRQATVSGDRLVLPLTSNAGSAEFKRRSP